MAQFITKPTMLAETPSMSKTLSMKSNNAKKVLGFCVAAVTLLSLCLSNGAGAMTVRLIFGQSAPLNQAIVLNPGRSSSLSGLLSNPEQSVLDERGNLFIANFGTGGNGSIAVVPGSSTTQLYGQSVTPNQPVVLNPGSPSLTSLLLNPWGIAIDRAGDLFIANYSYLDSGNVIVVPGDSTSSLFGQAVVPGQPVELNPGNTPTLDSLVDGPSGIALNQAGDLVVTNFLGGSVVVVPSPRTTSIFGQATRPSQPALLNPGKTGSLAQFVTQPGVASFNAQGDLFIDNYANGNTVTVIPSPTTRALFGQIMTPNQPTVLDPGTPGTLSALLTSPTGIASDMSGNLFIANADSTRPGGDKIVVVPSPGETILFGQSVVSNQPVVLNPGVEGSLNALLEGPSGLTFSSSGDLFIVNSSGSNIVAIEYQAPPLLAQRPLRISNTYLVGSSGSPITLTTTGGSGVIAPSYSVTGAGCSIRANQVVSSRPSSCAVTARNPANGRYAAASAVPVTFRFLLAQSLLVVANVKLTAVAGTPVALAARGGSGSGGTSFLVSGFHCTVSGGLLQTTSPTTCVIRVAKAASGTYGPALSAPTEFTFLARKQSELIIAKQSKVGTVGVGVVMATSGGSGTGLVSYAASGQGCSIVGNKLTKTMSGSCVVQATKGASGTYDSARSAPTSFFFLAMKR